MSHFVCDGSCKGEAEHPGNCQAESCERFGKELRECDCTDGTHGKPAVEPHPAVDDHPIDG